MTKSRVEDGDELTFGSRPPTAPTKKKELNSPSTPYDPDNSMVNMGQVTADRRNDLIGNAF
jgi:hypothetical protein